MCVYVCVNVVCKKEERDTYQHGGLTSHTYMHGLLSPYKLVQSYERALDLMTSHFLMWFTIHY